MKVWGRWIVGTLAGAVVALAVLYAISALRGPTAAQAEALALMERPSPAAGRNAFAALSLLPFDVPDAELRDLPDGQVRGYAERLRAAQPERDAGPAEIAAGIDSGQRAGNAPAPPCRRGRGCLARVGEQRDAASQWREHERRLLGRIDALSQYGHYRGNAVPEDLAGPLPPVGDITAPLLSDRALAFVDGDSGPALAQVCTDIGTWRGLAPNSDSLLVGMVGQRLVTELVTLFADMLAALPAGEPVPAACDAALAAPHADELSLCQPLKGEFRLGRALRARSMRQAGELDHLLYSQSMTDAALAAAFAPACSADRSQALARDRPLPAPSSGGWLRLDCVRNLTGCLIAATAVPAYRDYLLRAQDHGARLRLAGTLLWLHRHDGGTRSLKERLAARPAALRSPVRAVGSVDGGRSLRVSMYGQWPDKHFRLPLRRARGD